MEYFTKQYIDQLANTLCAYTMHTKTKFLWFAEAAKEEEAFGLKIRRMIEEDLKMNADQRKALLDHFVGSKAKVQEKWNNVTY